MGMLDMKTSGMDNLVKCYIIDRAVRLGYAKKYSQAKILYKLYDWKKLGARAYCYIPTVRDGCVRIETPLSAFLEIEKNKKEAK
jgi:hypothetical protein